jgi:hypothetical protein
MGLPLMVKRERHPSLGEIEQLELRILVVLLVRLPQQLSHPIAAVAGAIGWRREAFRYFQAV